MAEENLFSNGMTKEFFINSSNASEFYNKKKQIHIGFVTVVAIGRSANTTDGKNAKGAKNRKHNG